MKRIHALAIVALLFSVLLVAACGGDGDDERFVATPTPSPTATSEAAAPTSAPTTAATSAPQGDNALGIGSVGDTLAFDNDQLSAATGSEVVVRFTNNSVALSHNWVLVEKGTKDDVASVGLVVGPDNDYVSAGDERVVAHTKVLDPGATGEVRFTAPVAGTYQFVCTVPGHNVTMFGDFEVTP
jgi:azurin